MPDETPVAEFTAEQQDAMYSALKTLDPEKSGLTMNKLRPFYPNQGWGEIRGTLMALKEAGRVTYKLRKPPGAKVAYEFFTWV